MSNAGKHAMGGLAGKLRFEHSNNQIVGIDQNNLWRMLLTANNQGFSLKIAMDGKDVRTASDDELVFNSDRNIFKIVDSGVVTVEKPGNAETATKFIRHGFDYPPMVLGFAQSSLDVFVNLHPLPDIRVSSSGSIEGPGLVTYQASIAVDLFNIYFGVETPNVGGSPAGPYASNISVDFHYYILQETARPA